MNTWRVSGVKFCKKGEQRQLNVGKRWAVTVMLRMVPMTTEMEKVQVA